MHQEDWEPCKGYRKYIVLLLLERRYELLDVTFLETGKSILAPCLYASIYSHVFLSDGSQLSFFTFLVRVLSISLVEMEDCCHVFQKEDDIYNAVLGMADLAKNTNSYYKLQVLVHDSQKRYHLSLQLFCLFS